MTLFFDRILILQHFTQVHKTFNCTVDLQVGFLKHLGDVATVLLDLVCRFLHVIPDRLDDDKSKSLCGALAVVHTKISLDYYDEGQN